MTKSALRASAPSPGSIGNLAVRSLNDFDAEHTPTVSALLEVPGAARRRPVLEMSALLCQLSPEGPARDLRCMILRVP
jgi:hypothetical protein